VSNCPSPVRPVDSVTDDGVDIAELSAVWAVLNVVEAGTAEGDREIAEIRRGLNQVLAEHSLAPADVFEYIAEHVEQCDWRALGLSHVEPKVEEALMGRANDSDRYVVPNQDRGGWDVVREDRQRASAHTDTKAEAVSRAREIVRNQGGGEIRIANQQGRFIDSDTVSGPRHRESPARDRK
jgi:hypothetical protein